MIASILSIRVGSGKKSKPNRQERLGSTLGSLLPTGGRILVVTPRWPGSSHGSSVSPVGPRARNLRLETGGQSFESGPSGLGTTKPPLAGGGQIRCPDGARQWSRVREHSTPDYEAAPCDHCVPPAMVPPCVEGNSARIFISLGGKGAETRPDADENRSL